MHKTAITTTFEGWLRTSSKLDKGLLSRWARILLVLILLLWSLASFAEDIPQLVSGIPLAVDYIKGMYPPNWDVLPTLVTPIIEQFRMSIMSVFLSVAITTGLSLLAAQNTSPHWSAYILSRGIINLCRGLPTMIWALLFVVMSGLGPMAGVLALTTHCIGSLGKYFSESIETMGPQVKEIMEAMSVDGADKFTAICYGLMPAVAPLFASYTMYYFEWTLRVGTTLGIVGAGGLGLQLMTSIRLFRKQETAAIVIAILAIVTIVDTLSRVVRKRLLDD